MTTDITELAQSLKAAADRERGYGRDQMVLPVEQRGNGRR